MKAILIDVKKRTLTEVDVDSSNTLEEWYKLIDCNLVEVAMELPNNEHNGNSIMVDEEGMLSIGEDSGFFTMAGGHQPFAGNGLIVGINYDNGETIDVSITVDYLKDKINFFTFHEVKTLVGTDMY